MTLLKSEYEARSAQQSDIADHLPVLHDTVRRYVHARVVELGVRTGVSTAAFLAAVEAVDGHLWSVDIAQPDVPDWWQATGLWTLTVGDDIDPGVVAAHPASVDVLFLDTSHAWGHTLSELRVWVPRVAPGGMVLCHDTELERPDAAPAGDPLFPVARALDAYCEEAGLAWQNRPGCWGLGVITIPGGRDG